MPCPAPTLLEVLPLRPQMSRAQPLCLASLDSDYMSSSEGQTDSRTGPQCPQLQHELRDPRISKATSLGF
jgi:hypothetical protein